VRASTASTSELRNAALIVAVKEVQFMQRF
jgi:hypothetical protein